MRLFAVAAVLLITMASALFGPHPAPTAAQPVGATKDAPLLLVLDTSGSMGDSDSNGVHKLSSAKRSVLGAVQRMSAGATVGVWTYPAGDDCAGAGFLPGLDMRTLDSDLRSRLVADVLALRPTGGTPTAPALRSAAKALSDKGFTGATMVLVSDGESTCGGDPCAVAKEIVADGFDLQVHGVGFELSGSGRDEVQCIVDATKGRYISAENGQDLIDALAELTQRNLDVTVSAPAKIIGGGIATVALTVRNTSLTESAKDVRISLAFVDGAQMFPRVAPPVVRIGNLPPGQAGEFTWKLPVAMTDDSVTATYRIIATAASGAYGGREEKITVVKSGAYGDVAGGLLAELLRDPETKVGVFGDSYASGEGAGSYLPGSDKVDRRCHRSESTHIAQLFSARRTLNFACSGAVQHHLFGPYPLKMPIMSQVEEMSRNGTALDAAFVSIGGNDVGFAGVVADCVWINRAELHIAGPSTVDGGPATLVADTECGQQDATAAGMEIGERINATGLATRLSALGTQLPDTYRKLYDAINVRHSVAERGHEAPLFVLGYPKVFPEVLGIGCGEFAPREVTFANKVVRELNAVLRDAVADAVSDGRGIYFIDAVEYAMQPSNTLCDTESGITGIGLGEALGKTAADMVVRTALAQELVHPTELGYTRIAGAIASWSSGPAAPTGAGGDRARTAPNVITGEPTCKPLALTQADLDLSVRPGQCITVHVTASRPSTYWAEVRSTPIALGGGEVGAGASELRIDLPTRLTTGRHTLHVILVSESGEVTEYAIALRVAPPLPWWWWMIAVGSAVCIAAAGILAVRVLLVRRRAVRADSRLADSETVSAVET
ncbi:GDSL-type esterase/lipase family protein [Nocardia puris]|uniref:GDSL-type esterase/lipase family protein n=1 Tax=Nocardia puris TaxID=208602 RepID=UPI002E1A6CCE